MKKTLMAACAMLALGVAPALAQQKTIKIGFISTFSGPTAVIGNDMRNSFELALDHLGRKIGGLPVEVIYEDDGQKPELGKQKTDKLIESDKVDFIVGYIWSNVLLASLKSAVDAQTFIISANAGPSQIAGELRGTRIGRDQEGLGIDGGLQRGEQHVGPDVADDEIDLVGLDQLFGLLLADVGLLAVVLVDHLDRLAAHLAAQMVERELERVAHVVADHSGGTAEGGDKADLDGVARARGLRQRQSGNACQPECLFHIGFPS